MESKKSPKADLRRKSGMLLNLGLVISIGLVLFAFEHKTYQRGPLKEINLINDDFEDLLDIPITTQVPPPPPIHPIIEEVSDEIELEDLLIPVIDINMGEPVDLDDFGLDSAPNIETADEIVDFAEVLPQYPGGMQEWQKYLQKNLKYPVQAKRMGIEGTVYVVFVVNTDGSIQDVEVIRGIGGGCDEEAVRVISNAPKWTPGKQRGIPVRVRMRLPVRFKLG